jgi:hypothetical protein
MFRGSVQFFPLANLETTFRGSKDLESTLVPFFESVEWGDEREAHRIAAKQASSGYGQFRKRPVQKTARSKNVGNPTLLSTVALWVTRGRRLGKDF